MKRHILSIFIAVLVALPAAAQRINIDVPGLEARASEVVDVTLDANMLRMASKFLSSHDRDERNVRDMVQNLQGIYVRSYEFDKEGEYDQVIVERLRNQLGSGWTRIVTVRSKVKDNVDIYTLSDGKNGVKGLVVISAEPKELTIVNIVGPIDLDRLADMEGQFGIPKIEKESKEPKQ